MYRHQRVNKMTHHYEPSREGFVFRFFIMTPPAGGMAVENEACRGKAAAHVVADYIAGMTDSSRSTNMLSFEQECLSREPLACVERE